MPQGQKKAFTSIKSWKSALKQGHPGLSIWK
jgi:hypothetical protein